MLINSYVTNLQTHKKLARTHFSFELNSLRFVFLVLKYDLYY